MKKFIVVLLTISLLSFSCALPVFSIDEPQWYDLTAEQTLALINASSFDMVITYSDSSTFHYEGGAYSGFIQTLGNSSNLSDFVIVRLPNTHPVSDGRVITGVSIIFPFSLQISSCSQIYAPATIAFYRTSVTGFSNFSPWLNYFRFQADNSNAPLGSQVVFQSSFVGSTRSLQSYNFAYNDGYICFAGGSNTEHPAAPTSSYNSYGHVMDGRLGNKGYSAVPFSFTSSDITSIGYDISFKALPDTNMLDVCLILSPISFYSSSYNFPDDPDTPPVDSGDYTEQLDKIYDELVKQGQIQQSQNDALLQGQQDIKDSIDSGFSDIKDTLVTTSPEQDSQISENSSIITSQSEVISSMAQEIDDFNSSVGGGGHKAEAHSGAGHIASATDDIDFDNPSSIWSIIGSFFEGHGGLLITIAVFTWLFVLFKIILYGVHS